jgi:hypothetical protein
MPRLTKPLPPNRAGFTFGDLVYWHLFKYGTRPAGDPSDKIGRVWELDAIGRLINVTDRTLRNWIFDKNLPDSVIPLSTELFGNNKNWNDARIEFQEKFEQAWAAKGRKAAPSPSIVALEEPTGQSEAGDIKRPADEPIAHTTEEPVEPPAPEPTQSATASSKPDPQPSSGGRETIPPHALHIYKPLRNPARRLTAVVAGLVALLGIYGWVQSARDPDRSGATQPKPTAQTAPPKAPEPEIQVTEQLRSEPPPVQRSPALDPAAQPPVSRPDAPVRSEQTARQSEPEVRPDHPVQTVAPHIPTEAEKRVAEEQRIERQTIQARKEAHDAEVRQRDAEALRLDAEAQEASDEQQDREREARLVAGIGYRLQENKSVAGAASRTLLTENVADCALACTRESCDAFGYYRDQYGRGSRQPRYCYLFKKPFTPANYVGFVLGEPVADPPSGEKPARAGAAAIEAPIRLAQAGPAATLPDPDGLTRCASGPVKVTGFKLTCDQIMSGGTTLGSTRLSYTVANINECAAKCRADRRCVGFTFNGADPPGQHSCQIFGPTPETRESKGWISGVR